ncbi:golgin subfamily A member 6-like protein 7 [Cajanus cajan]|uniref:golgin subfamily A member 6-like protein 7 n=1 Tax=Cajanus cajan TaxID=3821 RepID=UPI00098D7D46|nr:golgin subfamily A member 6-like protein 7 [Cajanus cajan]
MDQLKNQNVETLTHNIKAHNYLVKLTQLFVSVSLCSFIFSPSSFLLFFHYIKFYFSTFPFQLYTHNIDKNCMFLLCNGLLVFVGITRSLSGSNCDEKTSTYIKDGSHSQSHFSVIETNELMLEIVETEEKSSEHDEQNIAAEQVIEIETCAEEVQEDIEKIILVDEGQEKGSSLVLKEEEELDEETELLDVGHEDEEEEDKGSEFDYFLIEESMEEEEENVEEEEECCMLSTEELNRKVEDFIRKMKEDLRIEAQRQLVMV